MTLQKLLDEGAGQLKQAGIAEAELDARYLLLEAFDLSASAFLLQRTRELACGAEGMEPETSGDACAVRRYRNMIEERCRRVPLQYIIGTQEFMGLEFMVDKRVLIPRQDTEDLVELVLRDHPEKDKSVLDMCTGSGCIAISLGVLGGYRQITAADISEGALEVAAQNGERLGVSSRFTLVRSNLYENQAAIAAPAREGYDILVSNPPYIPTRVIKELQPEVRDYEPVLALDGTDDGLYFYRLLAKQSGRFLRPGGSIYLEIGYDQGAAVSGLLREAGYEKIEVIKDTPGLDRIVRARI